MVNGAMQRCIPQRTNQNFLRLISLLKESRSHFVQIELFKKLILRFWHCLEGYTNKETYCEIMLKYFSRRAKGKNVQRLQTVNAKRIFEKGFKVEFDLNFLHLIVITLFCVAFKFFAGKIK